MDRTRRKYGPQAEKSDSQGSRLVGSIPITPELQVQATANPSPRTNSRHPPKRKIDSNSSRNAANDGSYNAVPHVNPYLLIQQLQNQLLNDTLSAISLKEKPRRPRSVSPEKKGTTSWYYYLYSDVEIPEICAYSISKRCSFEDKGCQRLHSKCATHWQFDSGEHWYNFREFHSKQLEEAYQDPNQDYIQLIPLNPNFLDKNSRGLLKLLKTNSWVANFSEMKLKHGNTEFPIRRLSTRSSALSKSSISTIYDWYFQDVSHHWIKFGNVGSDANAEHAVQIVSEDIELHYCTKKEQQLLFQSQRHKYSLDFNKMEQTNLETKKIRKVKRRPRTRLMGATRPIASNLAVLPNNWKTMNPKDKYICVDLDDSSYEFQSIKKLFDSLNNTVCAVKRIQNIDLLESYNIKRKQMMKKYKDEATIDEKRMFHGTKSVNTAAICEHNCDFRLYGTNAGHKYGKGAYFSNRPATAYGFCDRAGMKTIFVFKVLVGTYCQGSSDLRCPPENPNTKLFYETTVDNLKMPVIFVKYDKTEYYPEYYVNIQ